MYEAGYKSKLISPTNAVELIPSRGTLSMGMAVSEPPALLRALEDRVKAGRIEELRVYYSHSTAAAAFTILKYEYTNVIKPHPFFPTIIERRLFETGQQDNRRVVFYMPGNFSLDFVRGAQLSKGSKSILAAYSTAGNGAISRIVAKVESPTIAIQEPILSMSLPNMASLVLPENRPRKEPRL